MNRSLSSYTLPINVDKETGEHLLEELEKALEILSGYTSRMKAEVEERKDIHETMDTFIWHQQKLLYDAKTKQKVRNNKQTNICKGFLLRSKKQKMRNNKHVGLLITKEKQVYIEKKTSL